MNTYYCLSNGIRLPRIGAGTFPYKEDLITSIPQMINVGYRLFDTSDNYESEQFVGRALSSVPLKNDDCIIVTKYSDPLQCVKQAFSRSCSKLGRQPDIYLMHWPFPHLYERRWQEMEDLYLEKRVKAIGVCNFTPKYLENLISKCQIKPMINQIECHPMFQQADTLKYCRKEGILVMSYSPFARMNKTLFENKTLIEISQKRGITIPQLIISWNIHNGRLPIPASSSAAHFSESFNALTISLSNNEIEEIDKLESGLRIRYDPDTRFNHKFIRRFRFHSFLLKIKDHFM